MTYQQFKAFCDLLEGLLVARMPTSNAHAHAVGAFGQGVPIDVDEQKDGQHQR